MALFREPIQMNFNSKTNGSQRSINYLAASDRLCLFGKGDAYVFEFVKYWLVDIRRYRDVNADSFNSALENHSGGNCRQSR